MTNNGAKEANAELRHQELVCAIERVDRLRAALAEANKSRADAIRDGLRVSAQLVHAESALAACERERAEAKDAAHTLGRTLQHQVGVGKAEYERANMAEHDRDLAVARAAESEALLAEMTERANLRAVEYNGLWADLTLARPEAERLRGALAGLVVAVEKLTNAEFHSGGSDTHDVYVARDGLSAATNIARAALSPATPAAPSAAPSSEYRRGYERAVEDAVQRLEEVLRKRHAFYRGVEWPEIAAIRSLLPAPREVMEEGACCVCGRLASACAKPIIDPEAYPDDGEWFCSKECNEVYVAAEGDYGDARALLKGPSEWRVVHRDVLQAAADLLARNHSIPEPNLGRSICVGCGRTMAAATGYVHGPDCKWRLAFDGLNDVLKEKG